MGWSGSLTLPPRMAQVFELAPVLLLGVIGGLLGSAFNALYMSTYRHASLPNWARAFTGFPNMAAHCTPGCCPVHERIQACQPPRCT